MEQLPKSIEIGEVDTVAFVMPALNWKVTGIF